MRAESALPYLHPRRRGARKAAATKRAEWWEAEMAEHLNQAREWRSLGMRELARPNGFGRAMLYLKTAASRARTADVAALAAARARAYRRSMEGR